MTHQRIKDIAQTPSGAIRAMITGLRTQAARPDFEIDMEAYGDAKGKVCFGCAATCTLQQLSGKNLTPDTIVNLELRAQAYGYYFGDTHAFEQAMNLLRQGMVIWLMRYFDVEDQYWDARVIRQKHGLPWFNLPKLTNVNWETEIAAYEVFAEWLAEVDL